MIFRQSFFSRRWFSLCHQCLHQSGLCFQWTCCSCACSWRRWRRRRRRCAERCRTASTFSPNRRRFVHSKHHLFRDFPAFPLLYEKGSYFLDTSVCLSQPTEKKQHSWAMLLSTRSRRASCDNVNIGLEPLLLMAHDLLTCHPHWCFTLSVRCSPLMCPFSCSPTVCMRVLLLLVFVVGLGDNCAPLSGTLVLCFLWTFQPRFSGSKLLRTHYWTTSSRARLCHTARMLTDCRKRKCFCSLQRLCDFWPYKVGPFVYRLFIVQPTPSIAIRGKRMIARLDLLILCGGIKLILLTGILKQWSKKWIFNQAIDAKQNMDKTNKQANNILWTMEFYFTLFAREILHFWNFTCNKKGDRIFPQEGHFLVNDTA